MATRRQYSFPTSSQLERIVKCPASFWGDHNHFGQPLPEPHPALIKEGNTAADIGTKLHACIEAGFVDPVVQRATKAAKGFKGWDLVKSMDKAFELDVSDAFQDCVPAIEKTFDEIGCGFDAAKKLYYPAVGFFYCEVGLGFTREGKTTDPVLTDPYESDVILAGRADLVTFRTANGKDTCVVVDWKFGAHPVEVPENNLQLISLAAMALSVLSPGRDNYDSCQAQLVISYPSSGDIVHSYCNMTEIVKKFRSTIEPVVRMEQVRATKHRTDVPGDHCVYCPRKAHCWSMAERGIRIAQHIKAAL